MTGNSLDLVIPERQRELHWKGVIKINDFSNFEHVLPGRGRFSGSISRASRLERSYSAMRSIRRS